MNSRTISVIEREAELAFRDCGGVSNNMCDVVSNEFAYRMESEFDWVVHSPVRAKPKTGGKHFVAIVELSSIPEANSTAQIVVDMTISQFGDDYPDQIIAPIQSSIVSETYESIQI